MRRLRHNLIRRAQSDFRRYGQIALDTVMLLDEVGIDIEALEQCLLSKATPCGLSYVST